MMTLKPTKLIISEPQWIDTNRKNLFLEHKNQQVVSTKTTRTQTNMNPQILKHDIYISIP